MAINFGESTAVLHTVGEREYEFYPISVGLMLKLRTLLGPIGKAIGVLTSGGPTDTGSIYREFGDPIKDEQGQVYRIKRKDGSEVLVRDSENIAEAISPELAMARSAERASAIESILNALFSDAAQESLAQMILDSLKERDTSVSQFLKNCPAPMYIEFVLGMCKANKGVFGPLVDRLGPIWSRLDLKLQERLADGKEQNGKDTRPETENDQAEVETIGKISQTT